MLAVQVGRVATFWNCLIDDDDQSRARAAGRHPHGRRRAAVATLLRNQRSGRHFLNFSPPPLGHGSLRPILVMFKWGAADCLWRLPDGDACHASASTAIPVVQRGVDPSAGELATECQTLAGKERSESGISLGRVSPRVHLAQGSLTLSR